MLGLFIFFARSTDFLNSILECKEDFRGNFILKVIFESLTLKEKRIFINPRHIYVAKRWKALNDSTTSHIVQYEQKHPIQF